MTKIRRTPARPDRGSRRSFLFAALRAGLMLTPAVLAAQSPSSAEVDAIFARWDKPGSPGCALGVVRDGQLIYSRGYGSVNLDYGLPLSDTSVFYLASVSKQFTAAAVAVAARQGKLSLDDDVRKWVPELPDYGTRITVRQLIHHTSGLRDYLGLMPLAGRRLQDVLTDDDLLALVSRQKALNFVPGTEYSYSNSGYVLLGVVLQRSTGKSLREFSDEFMFRPLGMTHTHFHDEPLHPIPNRAIGYDRDGDTFVINHLWNFDKVGDGGLYSSVRDLHLWDQNFYHDRIGGTGFIEELTTPGVLPTGTKSNYAFGLQVGEYRGLRTVDHGGTLMGFRTGILRFPDQRFSAIALCNVSEANAGTLGRRVAELYLGSRMAAARVPAATERPVTAEQLARLAGTYRSATDRSLIDVSVNGDVASVSGAAGRTALRPISAGRFAAVADPSLELEFEDAERGRPTKLRLLRDGRPSGTFDPVILVRQSPEELSAYAGAYHSDELPATYRVREDGGRLVIELPLGRPVVLRSPVRDEFVGQPPAAPPLDVRFTRDRSGTVTGLLIGSGRIHDLLFRKR